jgi:hypothetical protein
MAVKMAVVKNLVAVKGLQVAVNFDEGGSEGLPRSGNPVHHRITGWPQPSLYDVTKFGNTRGHSRFSAS